jgi:hypothetical protein
LFVIIIFTLLILFFIYFKKMEEDIEDFEDIDDSNKKQRVEVEVEEFEFHIQNDDNQQLEDLGEFEMKGSTDTYTDDHVHTFATSIIKNITNTTNKTDKTEINNINNNDNNEPEDSLIKLTQNKMYGYVTSIRFPKDKTKIIYQVPCFCIVCIEDTHQQEFIVKGTFPIMIENLIDYTLSISGNVDQINNDTLTVSVLQYKPVVMTRYNILFLWMIIVQKHQELVTAKTGNATEWSMEASMALQTCERWVLSLNLPDTSPQPIPLLSKIETWADSGHSWATDLLNSQSLIDYWIVCYTPKLLKYFVLQDLIRLDHSQRKYLSNYVASNFMESCFDQIYIPIKDRMYQESSDAPLGTAFGHRAANPDALDNNVLNEYKYNPSINNTDNGIVNLTDSTIVQQISGAVQRRDAAGDAALVHEVTKPKCFDRQSPLKNHIFTAIEMENLMRIHKGANEIYYIAQCFRDKCTALEFRSFWLYSQMRNDIRQSGHTVIHFDKSTFSVVFTQSNRQEFKLLNNIFAEVYKELFGNEGGHIGDQQALISWLYENEHIFLRDKYKHMVIVLDTNWNTSICIRYLLPVLHNKMVYNTERYRKKKTDRYNVPASFINWDKIIPCNNQATEVLTQYSSLTRPPIIVKEKKNTDIDKDILMEGSDAGSANNNNNNNEYVAEGNDNDHEDDEEDINPVLLGADQIEVLEKINHHPISFVYGAAGSGKTQIIPAFVGKDEPLKKKDEKEKEKEKEKKNRYDITIGGGNDQEETRNEIKKLIADLQSMAKIEVDEKNLATRLILTPTHALVSRIGVKLRCRAFVLHYIIELAKYMSLDDRFGKVHTVIIDEGSLVDDQLFMFALFMSLTLPFICRLVVIGDPYQLPSIREGAAFVDITQLPKSIPFVQVLLLQGLYRFDDKQSSETESSSLSDYLKAIATGDVSVLKGNIEGVFEVAEWTEDCVTEIYNEHKNKPEEFQVLCYTNDTRIHVNRKLVTLQNRTNVYENAHIDNSGGTIVNKFMNNNKRRWQQIRDEEKLIGWFTGQAIQFKEAIKINDTPFVKNSILTVCKIYDEFVNTKTRTELIDTLGYKHTACERIVILKDMYSAADQVFRVPIRNDRLFTISATAYCSTTHNAQGGERLVIHYILEPGAYRQMIYSGLSRAKKKCKLYVKSNNMSRYGNFNSFSNATVWEKLLFVIENCNIVRDTILGVVLRDTNDEL